MINSSIVVGSISATTEPESIDRRKKATAWSFCADMRNRFIRRLASTENVLPRAIGGKPGLHQHGADTATALLFAGSKPSTDTVADEPTPGSKSWLVSRSTIKTASRGDVHNLHAGMKKVSPNTEKIRFALIEHPEVLAEAYQTILRSKGYPNAYDALESLSRGAKITLADLHAFVDGLDPEFADAETKQRRKGIMPDTYFGVAPFLVRAD